MKKLTYLLAAAAVFAACNSGNKGYTVTGTVEGAADGDTDNALLFCGENAWRLDHMTTVPELMAELAGEYLPDSKK